jgi:hypothetical protein
MPKPAVRKQILLIVLALLFAHDTLPAQQESTKIETPYPGIALIKRSLNPPNFVRVVNMKILDIDLTAPGVAFKLSPPAGSLEVVNQTTLDFLIQEKAQFAVNVHFYLPVGASETNLIGLAASTEMYIRVSKSRLNPMPLSITRRLST